MSITKKGVKRQYGIEPGLVLWLPFDGDVRDYSGNGNHGALYGSTWVDGKNGFGKALSFDGVDDYVQVTNEPNFDLFNYITISAGIYKADWTVGSSNKMIFSKVHTAYEMFVLNQKYIAFQANRVGDLRAISTSTLNIGWNHVVFRFDKDNLSSKGQYHSLFLNGVIETLDWLNGDDTNTPFYTNNISPTIGCRATGTLYADCVIDEVRIYSRALNANEIWDLYQRGL